VLAEVYLSSKPCETGSTLLVLRHSWEHPLQRDFGAENPKCSTAMRAGVDTEDGFVAPVVTSVVMAPATEMVRDVVIAFRRR